MGFNRCYDHSPIGPPIGVHSAALMHQSDCSTKSNQEAS